ncbi:hypothetical protein Vadar_031545 [Vaccinium darrowii]|uniref:Uncharacterized protein n=1 Tax=Vaccinium darrowii TaxID=229202 RepID=A0ACB7Y3P5_9ERIC|nr:hypothetical protein Vadar_031545 [Vaccinium darrowii]
MACLNILVALAVVAVAFPSTLATDWYIGDSRGWSLNVNYTEWASGKTFYIGDQLIFLYKQGAHNVVKVINGTDFQQCTVPSRAVTLSTGDDVITLAEGKHWYICGFSNHCLNGMKLVITVVPQLTLVPAPTSFEAPPPSAATGIAFSKCQAWIVGVFSILVIIMD